MKRLKPHKIQCLINAVPTGITGCTGPTGTTGVTGDAGEPGPITNLEKLPEKLVITCL